MGDDYVDIEPTGPSRREFIRRGALLLGVGAWAAPLVQVVRQRGHREGADGAAAPEVIGVQQVPGECAACNPTCGAVVECGAGGGVLTCFCAPSASPYPMAACICAEDVFCDEAILCSAGCPDGWACVQGCCPQPVCLPPCPAPMPIVAPDELRLQAQGESNLAASDRLTVSGRRR